MRERRNLAQASGEMQNIRGQFESSRQEAAVSNIVETELLAAFEELQAERRRLQQASITRRRF